MARQYRSVTVDVFTDRALTGTFRAAERSGPHVGSTLVFEEAAEVMAGTREVCRRTA